MSLISTRDKIFSLDSVATNIKMADSVSNSAACYLYNNDDNDNNNNNNEIHIYTYNIHPQLWPRASPQFLFLVIEPVRSSTNSTPRGA